MQVSNSPYEYFGSTLCVRAPFLIKESGIISGDNYRNLTQRGHLNVVRPGKGKGNYALIEFDSMRKDIKDAVVKIEAPENLSFNYLTKYIKPDNEAIFYFANYRKTDGSTLTLPKQRIYATNAIILNACKEFEAQNISRKKKGVIWDNISMSINTLENYEFKLPNNVRALKRAFDEYIQKGYSALVHGGEGNDNSRKVSESLERLILSIYSMKNKPFATSVQQLYLQFLGGAINIVDTTTGEFFDPKDFQKNGSPITVSEATVWNYLNDPKNRILVDKYRSGSLEFNNTHRPHHHRHAPIFSLSKVSLDDRDLPRKMKDGKRVKAYYAYDVASGCVIGASYSKDKDTKLFIDCIRDMLLFLGNNKYGVPMEMEVEHHLVNNYKNDLMKAGVAFPFVRWCNAGNSQEKHAEHFNKAKKYGFEKRYQEGIGRWYAKSEAYRTIVEKVFDGENNNYKEKKFEFDSLVADDKETVVQYNNSLHPDQKKYKGLTRLQVLEKTINPNLAQFDDVIWARYVGDKTTTTIKRSQYVTVQHSKYQLPTHEMLNLLAPNDYTVDAYYLKNSTGDIPSVFIYQNEQFICECEKIKEYNTATSEHTEQDKLSIQKQSSYVAKFDAATKEQKSKISKIVLLENKYPTEVIPEVIEIVPQEIDPTDEFEYMLSNYDPKNTKDSAINNL